MVNISGIIKSIRNLMRGDKGINGDAQRIEQLGWMIFLKIFDDKDIEMELLEDKYKSPIPKKLQWRNWAADDEGITGDELLNFIDNKLFQTLKNLSPGTANRRAVVVREIFEGNNNYMKSGTIIRQVINKLNEINFNHGKFILFSDGKILSIRIPLLCKVTIHQLSDKVKMKRFCF